MKPTSPKEAVYSTGWKGDGGLQGVVLRMQEEMKKKIEKWQEKGPAKQGRVLPVPDMEPKKRRGGKRARKYKERYGLTDTKKVRPPCCPFLLYRVHSDCMIVDMPCFCLPSSQGVSLFVV